MSTAVVDADTRYAGSEVAPAGEQSAERALENARALRFRSEFTVAEAIGQVILWFILGVLTLGFAFFVFPYYVQKVVTNKVYVVNGKGETIGRLRCDVNLGQAIGHAFIWMLLTIITLGIAALIYAYKLTSYAMQNTVIEPV